MEIFKRVCSEKVRAREGNRERVITTSEAVVLANRNLALKQKANGLRNLSLLMDRHQQTIDPARVGGRGLFMKPSITRHRNSIRCGPTLTTNRTACDAS